MENLPKTNFDFLKEQMETKGFHYYGIENLYETSFKGKDTDNPNDRFKFIDEQVQTKEGLVDVIKNLPEFSEVKNNLTVELIQVPLKKESYYVFVKIND
jgi:hypothetical protein